MNAILPDFSASNSELLAILDGLPISVYIADKDGRTLFVNKAYSSLTGISLEEVKGRTTSEIERETRLFLGSITEEIVQRKAKVCSVAVLTKDGINIPAVILGCPILDARGELQFTVTVILNRAIAKDFTFLPQSSLYSGELVFAQKYGISPRELDIIDLLFQGYTYEQVAAKLFISIHTVRAHMRNIYNKTEIQNMGTLLQLYKDFKCFNLLSFSLDIN